jgi:hypothetical protein
MTTERFTFLDIHQVVPIEYTKSLMGLRQLLRKKIEISESTEDKRLKLQAISIAAEINKDIIDLCHTVLVHIHMLDLT